MSGPADGFPVLGHVTRSSGVIPNNPYGNQRTTGQSQASVSEVSITIRSGDDIPWPYLAESAMPSLDAVAPDPDATVSPPAPKKARYNVSSPAPAKRPRRPSRRPTCQAQASTMSPEMLDLEERKSWDQGWTQADDQDLLIAVRSYTVSNTMIWDEIRRRHFPKRSAFACQTRFEFLVRLLKKAEHNGERVNTQCLMDWFMKHELPFKEIDGDHDVEDSTSTTAFPAAADSEQPGQLATAVQTTSAGPSTPATPANARPAGNSAPSAVSIKSKEEIPPPSANPISMFTKQSEVTDEFYRGEGLIEDICRLILGRDTKEPITEPVSRNSDLWAAASYCVEHLYRLRETGTTPDDYGAHPPYLSRRMTRSIARAQKRSADELATDGESPLKQLRDVWPESERRYGCPYRKRNTLRFNIRDHAACALGHFSFARLKMHVRLCHARSPFECQICRRTFKDSDGLRDHMQEAIICQPRGPNPEDGVDECVAEILKEGELGDGRDTWQALWGILFPGTPIESAVYEAPVELPEVYMEFGKTYTDLNKQMGQYVSQAAERAAAARPYTGVDVNEIGAGASICAHSYIERALDRCKPKHARLPLQTSAAGLCNTPQTRSASTGLLTPPSSSAAPALPRPPTSAPPSLAVSPSDVDGERSAPGSSNAPSSSQPRRWGRTTAHRIVKGSSRMLPPEVLSQCPPLAPARQPQPAAVMQPQSPLLPKPPAVPVSQPSPAPLMQVSATPAPQLLPPAPLSQPRPPSVAQFPATPVLQPPPAPLMQVPPAQGGGVAVAPGPVMLVAQPNATLTLDARSVGPPGVLSAAVCPAPEMMRMPSLPGWDALARMSQEAAAAAAAPANFAPAGPFPTTVALSSNNNLIAPDPRLPHFPPVLDANALLDAQSQTFWDMSNAELPPGL